MSRFSERIRATDGTTRVRTLLPWFEAQADGELLLIEPLSPRNSEVARLRALARERRARHEVGRFIVEGEKLVAEVLASDLIVYDAYVEAGWSIPASLRRALEQADVEITVVSTRAIERIASTNSPQPIVAEVRMSHASWADLAAANAILVAADINDPGNVGTLMRSAVASGFDAVVMLGDSADAFAPKVVRSSAGALFRVPVVTERDVGAGLTAIGELGLVRLGTRMEGATACTEADLRQPLALVLGNEAHGLDGVDQSVQDLIDDWLMIPMPGETESLNVAMAGTILAYETARQRRS